MAPEETLHKDGNMSKKEIREKALSIVFKKGRERGNDLNAYHVDEQGVYRNCMSIDRIDDNQILFDRSFREALVGKEFVYTKAFDFSSTGYVSDECHLCKIKVNIADYHLMMCARSDDRIGYLQSVLDKIDIA